MQEKIRLSLDKYTKKYFLEKNISDIYVHFITAGCAGKKIHIDIVQPKNKNAYVFFGESSGIKIYCLPEEKEFFIDGKISYTKEKKYFWSPKIQTRCACGSSFDFEKKLISSKKIHQIREKIQLAREKKSS